MTVELLDAVDQLTKPDVEHHPQHIELGDETGIWIRQHKVELPPLLSRLVEAIHSSTSGKAGGGNAATRAVLNSDALYESMRITSTVTDWCNIEKITPTRNTVTDLRRWYVARLARTDADDTFYVGQLRKWAGTIRYLLDPPRRFEITDPCPECKADKFVDELGDSFAFPLLVEYREQDDTLKARVTCRACGLEWADTLPVGSNITEGGLFRLRAFRHDIDTNATPNLENRSQ